MPSGTDEWLLFETSPFTQLSYQSIFGTTKRVRAKGKNAGTLEKDSIEVY